MAMWFMIWQKMNRSVVRFKRVQYYVFLTITGVIRGTSQENLYRELGLESLKTIKKIFKAYVLFLQTNYNSKAIISFQSDTSSLREWNKLSTKFVVQPLTNNFHRQISLLILSKFRRINEFLFSLKSSGNFGSLIISGGTEVD